MSVSSLIEPEYFEVSLVIFPNQSVELVAFGKLGDGTTSVPKGREWPNCAHLARIGVIQVVEIVVVSIFIPPIVRASSPRDAWWRMEGVSIGT